MRPTVLLAALALAPLAVQAQETTLRVVSAFVENSQYVKNLQGFMQKLNAEGKVDREVADTLNAEQVMSARGTPFKGETVHLLRRRWGVPAARINGADPNPARWPDCSHSVQGAAAALHATAQTIFKWLRRGRLCGRQSAKGQPWQIHLTADRTAVLAAPTRWSKQSNREAS